MGIIGRILIWIAAAVGLAIWLIGTYQLTMQSAMPDELPRKIAVLVGVPLLLIGSVIFLRLSGRLVDFLAGLAFAALLCVYGIGMDNLNPHAPSVVAQNDTGATSNDETDAPSPSTEETPSAASTTPPPSITPPATTSTDDVLSRGSGRGRTDNAGPSPAPPSPADSEQQQRPSFGRSIEDDVQPAPASSPLSANEFTMEELRFNKPDSMRLNQPYTIEAQIGVPTTPALSTSGPRVTRSVPIPGSRMVRVELVSPDFEIQKLHQVDNQLLTPGTTASWMWRVTPRSADERAELLLQVFGVLRQQGYEGTVLIRTYQESIPVEVTAIDRAQLGAQAFLARWNIIAGIAGALGGIWVFFTNIMKALRGRREQTA